MDFRSIPSSFLKLISLACLIAFSSSAPASDASNWSDKTMCRLLAEKHSTKHAQFLKETKKRGLICNKGKVTGYKKTTIASSKSISKTVVSNSTDPICSKFMMSACDNHTVCTRATTPASEKKTWQKSSNYFYKYVAEAKKRGLSCGIPISKPKKLKCSSNPHSCTYAELCASATTNNGKNKTWWKPTPNRYVSLAKKKKFTCGVSISSATKKAQAISSTPKPKPKPKIKKVSAAAYTDKSICRLIGEKHPNPDASHSQEAKKRNLICSNGKITGYIKPQLATSKPTSDTVVLKPKIYTCSSSPF